MIKLVFCLHRLPGLSRAAFQTYWRESHAPLVRRHADSLGIIRYVQCHSLPETAHIALAGSRGAPTPEYDGVAELWWRDMASFAAAGATPAGREAGAILLEDERRFIDLARSPIFLVNEQAIITPT